MFEEVIVGIDEEGAGRDALELARQLASADRPLTLACVEVSMDKPGADLPVSWQTDRRRRAMARLASLRDASRVDASVLVVEARSVAIGLHELAAGRDADLLVIGASGEYERAFAGGDTRPVLEDAPCAVAVAPADYSTRPPAWQEIGVAYDGTPGSEQALAVARNLARERAAKLSAFTAVPVPLRVHDAWNAQRELDEEAEIARRRIAELGDVEARAGAA